MTGISSSAAPDDAAANADPTGSSNPEPPRSKGRSTKLFFRDVVLILLAAILISFLIKTFLIRSFYIPSGSMEDTLALNDRVIVNELVPKAIPLKHGDVVVFKDPGGWLGADEVAPDDRNALQKGLDAVLGFVGLAAPDSNDHLIKRVIGLPGDKVTCCSATGHLTVNGVPLDEPYVKIPAGKTDAAPESFSITVPAGKIWVMGDNRYDSEDSLAHYTQGDPGKGFLPESDLTGRAFVISWPASRWTWLSDYPATFDGTDKTSSSK